MRRPTLYFLVHVSAAAGLTGALLMAAAGPPVAVRAPITAARAGMPATQSPADVAAPEAPAADAVALRGPAPDLDVLWIARTPRTSWVDDPAAPRAGDVVTFVATVRNAGTRPAPPYEALWTLDGRAVDVTRQPALAPGASVELAWAWRWEREAREIGLRLLPSPDSRDRNPGNDARVIRSDALSLGVWVEASFHQAARFGAARSGWGGASFEDWLQRQVARWNGMLAEAKHPLTPEGITDRIRLDRVVIVPDGALDCRVENPQADYEQDLVWGFPAALVGAGDLPCDLPPTYAQDDTLWDRDLRLLHELSHARYLADTYGLNVRAIELALAGAVDAEADVLPVHLLPGLPALSPPVELVLGGEIVRCADIDGSAFRGCERGVRDTRARPHASGTALYGGGVLLTDGEGNALAGSAALPARSDHFHLGPDFGADLMNYGEGYGEHSAWAWNHIAGQRPVCGNYNAPCNLGAYLSELPERSELTLRWADGRPAAHAAVTLYRPTPRPGWYGRQFGDRPDAQLRTDAEGRLRLGSQPFGDQGIVHDEGHSNAVLALRVRDGERLAVTFVDVAAFNLARARQGRQSASIALEIADWAERPTLAAPQRRALPADAGAGGA